MLSNNAQFSLDLASALNLNSTSIIIKKTFAGSTLIDVIIPVLSSSELVYNLPTIENQVLLYDNLKSSLNSKLADYNSNLYTGSILSSIKSVNISAESSIIICSGNQYNPDGFCLSSSTSNSQTASNNISIIIGVVVAVVFIALIVCGYYLYRRYNISTYERHQSIALPSVSLANQSGLSMSVGFGEISASTPNIQTNTGNSLNSFYSQSGDPSLLQANAIITTLPSGWSQHDDGQGNVYYYNSDTGVSTWTRPL